MNTPTHVMSGAFLAQALMACRDRYPQRTVAIGCGLVAFVAGVFLHVGLDALPHNNWIVSLNWCPGVPFHWLICEALCALPFAIVGAWLGRDHPIILCAGIIGGMYPDFEKVAYVDFHIPRALVMFPGHSLQLSSRHGDWPLWQTATLEVALVTAMIAGALLIARWRCGRFVGNGRGQAVGEKQQRGGGEICSFVR